MPSWALEDAFSLAETTNPEVVALLGRPGKVSEAGLRRVEGRVGERQLVGFVPTECADAGAYLEEKVAEMAQREALPTFIVVNAPCVDRHAPGEKGGSRGSGSGSLEIGKERQRIQNQPYNSPSAPPLRGGPGKERV